MPPIDQNKVDTFLEEWNRGREPNNPLWVEVQGTSSLMSVDTSPSGVVFKGNQGFIVKAFMNTETGEVRTFNVRRFVE